MDTPYVACARTHLIEHSTKVLVTPIRLGSQPALWKVFIQAQLCFKCTLLRRPLLVELISTELEGAGCGDRESPLATVLSLMLIRARLP